MQSTAALQRLGSASCRLPQAGRVDRVQASCRRSPAQFEKKNTKVVHLHHSYTSLQSGSVARLKRCSRSRSLMRTTTRCNIVESSTEGGDQSKTEDAGADSKTSDGSLKNTVSNLEAILGLEPEEKDEPEPQKAEPSEEDGTKYIAEDALKKMLEADAARRVEAGADAGELDTDARIQKIVETVQKLADDSAEELSTDEMKGEYEKLVEFLTPEALVPKEDVEIMKKSVFGFGTFWVTSDGPFTDDPSEPGWIFRGNLRAPRNEVYATLEASMREQLGNKYELMMVEDLEAELAADMGDKATSGPRVSFILVPSTFFEEKETTGFQYGVAALLAFLTLGSAIQLGVVAEVNTLPPALVEWFRDPDNMDGDLMLPPGIDADMLDDYVLGLLATALPIYSAVLGSAAAHETGHFVAGLVNNVKTSVPFFIPNGQLGTFGAVTQFKSRTASRTELFNVAAAGPACGGVVGLALLLSGLVMSSPGGETALVPLPSGLLQGSLLLGGLVSGWFGVDSASTAPVMVHPFVVAGWCTLVTTAFNLLPVGALDGGRMVQASYGRPALGFSGLFTYLGLAFGVLGSSLSLPFGIYVLLTQRTPERSPKDDVNTVASWRSTATLIAVTLAFLILLPMAPEADPNAMPINML